MTPTWGTSGSGWSQPTIQPKSIPAPTPQPIKIAAPVPIPGTYTPVGRKPVVPRPTDITPIVPAPKRKCSSPMKDTREHEEKTKRATPKKEKVKTRKHFPWEIARDFFMVRAKREVPADFLANERPIFTTKKNAVGPVGERPVSLFDERIEAPIFTVEKAAVPTYIPAGVMHTLVFDSPGIIPESLHAEYKQKLIEEIQVTGATVHSVSISPKEVVVKVMVP